MPGKELGPCGEALDPCQPGFLGVEGRRREGRKMAAHYPGVWLTDTGKPGN